MNKALFLHLKFAAKPDSALQPRFNETAQGETERFRKFAPLPITFVTPRANSSGWFVRVGLKVEFFLNWK
jgi:hypothetical protein